MDEILKSWDVALRMETIDNGGDIDVDVEGLREEDSEDDLDVNLGELSNDPQVPAPTRGSREKHGRQ